MNSPLVSIITPSYNRADVVRETADSILGQSYPHWEWMIVDDGSTDNSWEILQAIAKEDPRIHLLKRDREPKGACCCRNIGVLSCRGDYLLFLDTDDILAPSCLEQRVQAAMQHPDKDFLIFPMLMFRMKVDDMNVYWNINTDEDDLERFLSGDSICQGTGTFWKRESFMKTGLWGEQLKLWQDVELHVRILLMGMTYVKCMDMHPDIYLRVSYVSISRTGFHSPEKIESRIWIMASTLEKMIELQLKDRYKDALRHMFTDIFFSAANGRQLILSDRLLHLESFWHLFDTQERRAFRTYSFMQRYRLYKIQSLKRLLTERITYFVPPRISRIGTVPYLSTVR